MDSVFEKSFINLSKKYQKFERSKFLENSKGVNEDDESFNNNWLDAFSLSILIIVKFKMNLFRFIADMLHLAAICMLLYRIKVVRNCIGK